MTAVSVAPKHTWGIYHRIVGNNPAPSNTANETRARRERRARKRCYFSSRLRLGRVRTATGPERGGRQECSGPGQVRARRQVPRGVKWQVDPAYGPLGRESRAMEKVMPASPPARRHRSRSKHARFARSACRQCLRRAPPQLARRKEGGHMTARTAAWTRLSLPPHCPSSALCRPPEVNAGATNLLQAAGSSRVMCPISPQRQRMLDEKSPVRVMDDLPL